MSFAIAAAGTGGHVFPGLAVGEALVAGGVERSQILYLGGDRLEAQVYPAAGFPFYQVGLRGLRRKEVGANLGLPWVVGRAITGMRSELRRRRVRALLGMGGYVTVPAGIAARLTGVAVAVAEQNAEAGLANRIAGRIAARQFGAFPETTGLPRAEWVGNPVRRALASFDRQALRPAALARYDLDPDLPVLGVFGGSLGAGVLNQAVAGLITGWRGPQIQVLHLAGADHAPRLAEAAVDPGGLRWRVLGFEHEMEWFYAAADLVLARAGGAVAELAVTATPAILVPGGFGSGRHQLANAQAMAQAGAAVVCPEVRLGELAGMIGELMSDAPRRRQMATAAAKLAKPDAADRIAIALGEMHG